MYSNFIIHKTYNEAVDAYKMAIEKYNISYAFITLVLGVSRQAADYFHKTIPRKITWDEAEHGAAQIYFNLALNVIAYITSNDNTKRTALPTISIDENIDCLMAIKNSTPLHFQNYHKVLENSITRIRTLKINFNYSPQSLELSKKLDFVFNPENRTKILQEQLNILIDNKIFSICRLAAFLGMTASSLRYKLKVGKDLGFTEEYSDIVFCLFEFFSKNRHLLFQPKGYDLDKQATLALIWQLAEDNAVCSDLAHNIEKLFEGK